jgi:hypothetical protein
MNSDQERRAQLQALRDDAAQLGDTDKAAEIEADLLREFPEDQTQP